MKWHTICLQSLSVLVLAAQMAQAQDDKGWVFVDDPNELRKLVSGKSIDGKSWKFYYRADGYMGYMQEDYFDPDKVSISVREWTINDKGELCYNVYSRPEMIIDCATVRRSSGDPELIRMKGNTGVFKVRIVPPIRALVDAVAKRAGAE